MPSKDVTELLGEWEGYRIGFVQRHEPDKEGAAPHLWIELIREAAAPMICSGCGQGCERYHDWDERWHDSSSESARSTLAWSEIDGS